MSDVTKKIKEGSGSTILQFVVVGQNSTHSTLFHFVNSGNNFSILCD
jgi:hypothetical protein